MRSRFHLVRAACVAASLGAAALGGLAFAAEPRDPEPRAHKLRLAEFDFDPLETEPPLPDGWKHSQATVPDLHLVQFDGPIPADALTRMRAEGLEPVKYVFPDTYITWGRSADRERLRGHARVRWTGDFAPAFRVHREWRERRGQLLDVRVLIYRGAGVESVVAALSKIGSPIGPRTVVGDTLEIAGFRLRGELMRFAASIPGVYSIQPIGGDWAARNEVASQVNVNNVDNFGVAFPGYWDWLSAVGLNGAGVHVAIVDEGVDQLHPDLAAGYLPCTGDSCTVAPSQHGTHVAGIVSGDGESGETDANGFLRGLGVAPLSSISEQEFIMFKFLPGGVSELIKDSSRAGATISNNSWGTSSSAFGYNADALMIDAGVRDADPSTAGNQALFYVQAFGNGNGGVSSQGTPDEAKNSFVVGSTWAINTSGNPNPNIDSLSSNTAHGPALDGRRIPHLVAPGCYVDSTFPNLGGGYGHGYLCGTSMAAPQVSGAAALFTQYYRNLPGVTGNPSPALTKAALMAVGRDLAGHQDADAAVLGHRPDNKQGWGRLDVEALVTPPAGSVIYVDQTRIFEETGETWLREVTPVNPAQPMRIMLVWTDAPGPGLGGSTPGWSNNLDLVVEAGVTTYRGNVFGSNGWSTTGGTADLKNNAEGVFFAVPPSQLTIRVVASDINSDGVPGEGDDVDQDFALVCQNCAYAPGFDLDPHPITQDVCAPNAANYAILVEQHVGYTNPVTLAVTGVPPGASSAFGANPVAPGGQAALSINPGTAVDGDYTLQLDGNAGGLHRSNPLYLHVRRSLPAAATASAPAPGAVNVAAQPVLTWTAVPWAASYVVEVSTSATFQTIFYSAYSEATTHKVGQILAENTVYYWRVRARNVCGFGAFSSTSSFTTRNVPDVLLVDDDWDFYGDFQTDYRNAMNALPLSPYFYPVSYDVWDVYAVMQQKEPDYSTLALYKKVIWWSGNEDFYAGPTLFSELEMQEWFDRRGGCLLVSSADYRFARGTVSDFMVQKLGVGTITQDTEQNQVTGVGAAFAGLGTIGLKNLTDDYSDSVTPAAPAEPAFTGNMGNAGIDKNGGYYRTAFAGFGLERLFTAADRSKALLKFLQWCDGLPGVDGDGDGIANGTDCVPGDATAWTTPQPVTNLVASRGAIAFSWGAPVSSGGAVYDVLRSDRAADFWNASCIASGSSVRSVPSSADVNPAPGKIFFYLVRARSACGTAPMGSGSNGVSRQGTACE